jgi:branched-chain amino acid transport system substrate-binding protein
MSCSRGPSGTVLLGAAGPIGSANGDANMQGFDLALEELNARPGSNVKFDKVILNDSASGGVAARVAQQFVDNPRVIAVVGHVNSGTMMAAARVYDGHLPAVATSATSPSLSGISKWAFRVIPSDSLNGQRVADHMNALAKKRAMILYENNSYGRGLAESFRRGFKGEIVGMDPVSDKAGEDLEPFVTYLKQKQVDLVFMAGTGIPGAAFLKEARRQQVTAAVAGGNGWAVLVDDPNAEGVYFPTPFNRADTRPEVQAFVNAFQKKYNQPPNAYAALAYDATKLLAQAIERAGADRIKVRDYLANLSEPYAGVTGPIKFGDNGDPVGKLMAMARIHDRGVVAEGAR